MSQNKLENTAKILADELLNSGQKIYQEPFNVTDEKGNDTGERIVVYVVKTTARKSRRVQESTRMATLPAGERCPCCGGTGTVE